MEQTPKAKRFRALRRRRERGQALIIAALTMLVLLAVIGFAVDYSNAWFHRQSAQSAADAVCTAAVMDMLSSSTTSSNFTPGGASATLDCTGSPTPAPCMYATRNGYPLSSVTFEFPSSLSGIATCTTVGTSGTPSICDATGVTGNPYVKINVKDQIPLTFAALVSGNTTQNVTATATCGLVLSNAPIPILVLNPSKPGTLSIVGSGSTDKIKIWGGPQQSIQVNSSDPSAVGVSGGPTVNLTNAGPPGGGGGLFGVNGGPSTPNLNLLPSSSNWVHHSVITDPFAKLPAPSQPSNGSSTSVAAGVKGCPPSSGGCIEYSAGYFPSGIDTTGRTVIFDPGVYYLNGDLTLKNSCVRPSTAAGTGANDIGGTMFYFNSGTVKVDANAGTCSDPFDATASSGTGQLQYGIRCTTGSQLPAGLPSTIDGNVLLGPCTGTYGDPLGTNDPIGEQRGMVFFENRSYPLPTPPPDKNAASWGGNGTSALIGTMYFHYCNSADGPGMGTNCRSNAYTDYLSFGGNAGAVSYVAGEIVTDYLYMHGTPALNMYLNPNALYYVLKASLLR